MTMTDLPASQRLPEYLLADPTTRAVSETLLNAALAAENAREDVMQQISAATATWGIDLWEAMVGIVPSGTGTLEDRRSAVMARLRGAGTVTGETLQAIADSWRNGEATVSFDDEHSEIVLTFNGQLGVPEDIGPLQAAMRAAAPAHLEIRYDYRYLLIRDVTAQTLAQIGRTQLKQSAGGSST